MKRVSIGLGIGCAVILAAMIGFLAFALLLQPNPQTVVYSHAGGENLHLDIYRPAKTDRPTAAVVVIHGGGWAAGDRKDMAGFAEAMAKNGFLCAAVQYRFAPKYRWPAQLDDVQTAVRYLRANAKDLNIDPNRIGAAGGSAGGHLAQCLGVRDTRDPKPTEYPGYSSKVIAVWNSFGPVDFTQRFSDPVTALIKSLLGDGTAAQLKDASPVFFADKRSAPTFFFQGKSDPIVPWQQAQEMAGKLRSVGVEADLNLIEGMGHGPDGSNQEAAKAIQRGVEWMKAHLR